MDTESKRGGKRPGAGRPPIGDLPGKRINVYLEPHEIAILKKLGKGSVTAGIKKLIEREGE